MTTTRDSSGTGLIRQRVDWQLRHRLPKPVYHFVRSRYYDGRTIAGRNPGRGRLLPDFLIIGTAKSGTTTLHGWLSEHPFVEPAVKKEVHFFDYDYYRGVDWYRSHFPTEQAREAFERRARAAVSHRRGEPVLHLARVGAVTSCEDRSRARS